MTISLFKFLLLKKEFTGFLIKLLFAKVFSKNSLYEKFYYLEKLLLYMNSEDERIKELIFALRRDFKISKDIVNTLSKIGSVVVPHLIDAYQIDDFSFRLKIIETLGELGKLGLPGLVKLLDHSDIKNKITIIKTIRKAGGNSKSLNNSIIKKMEEIIEWKDIEYTDFQDLEDQVDDVIQYRDILVNTLLEIDKLNINTDTVKELAFITTHIYLRKLNNQEIKNELNYFYKKLLENKKITALEIEEIYKTIYKLDPRIEKILRSYLKTNIPRIKPDSIEIILKIVEEQLPRGIIYKNCDRNFYVFNYDLDKIRHQPNSSFYYGFIQLFTRKKLDTLTGITSFDNIKGIITEMKRDLCYDLEDLEDLYLRDNIDE